MGRFLKLKFGIDLPDLCAEVGGDLEPEPDDGSDAQQDNPDGEPESIEDWADGVYADDLEYQIANSAQSLIAPSMQVPAGAGAEDANPDHYMIHNAEVEMNEQIDEYINELPELAASTGGGADIEVHVGTRTSKWLQSLKSIVDSCEQTTELGTMSALLNLRKGHSHSKCHTFDPNNCNAIAAEVMRRRWRAVVLDAGDGRQMEVGTALRNARRQIETAHSETKLNSRIARWKRAGLVKGHPAPPLDTSQHVKVGDVFLMAFSASVVIPAVVTTVNKKFKNGLRPFGQLPLIDVETLGVQLFQQPDNEDRWVHWTYYLQRVPQCLLHKLHAPGCLVTKDPMSGRVSLVLQDANLQHLREAYVAMMPQYWPAIKATPKEQRSFAQ